MSWWACVIKCVRARASACLRKNMCALADVGGQEEACVLSRVGVRACAGMCVLVFRASFWTHARVCAPVCGTMFGRRNMCEGMCLEMRASNSNECICAGQGRCGLLLNVCVCARGPAPPTRQALFAGVCECVHVRARGVLGYARRGCDGCCSRLIARIRAHAFFAPA